MSQQKVVSEMLQIDKLKVEIEHTFLTARNLLV
jgi:hypothetical protein